MKYLLIRDQDVYKEYPISEIEKDFEENIWLYRDGKQIFYLGEEIHLFERGENVTISSGREAMIRISEMKSCLYIRGMQVFTEIKDNEYLYRNQRRMMPGNFMAHPGTVLFLKSIKIEVWENQIAIQGCSDAYTTILSEKLPVQKPEGFPVYKRSPRLIKRPSVEKILIELPKEREKPDKKGSIMAVIPAIGIAMVTIAIGLMTGRGFYLFMSAATAGMTAVFSGIKYVNEKKELGKKNKRQDECYREYLWHRQSEIARAYEYEQEVYSYQYPDMAELYRMTREYDSRIYERIASDDDFLTVSVGHYTGQINFMIEGKEPAWDGGEDILTKMAGDLRKKYSVIDKPKVVDLKSTHLGLIGEKAILHRQIKILIAQLTFFHSYHDLRIVVVYNKKYEEEFAWMRWFLHMRIQPANLLGLVSSERTRDLVLGSIVQILKERLEYLKEDKGAMKCFPHYLFLIDEASLIMDHAIMEYLRMDGKALGFSIIYTCRIRAELPEYIGSLFELKNSKEGIMIQESREYVKTDVQLHQAQEIDFEWLARDLSMLKHEQGAASYIPQKVTFFELYKVRSPKELNIQERWETSRSYQSLAVPIGKRSAEEIMFLNLHEKAHGPHGLVAGTTGSGKSELIQSYILSLAVNFHPYEVGFLLIDYKGGGMANLFRKLPHHMGTITNLDGSESMRALLSVKAEVERRQRILGIYQVNHINGYMRLFKEGLAKEPLPHLFIVCDEFAELKKEQPDFMKELISVARIGRSLGIHLILATQKPAGVVDEQIWSNSRFKLCLKVQNENDSKEVLRTSDAANITLPGRAYLQVGNNETYELFQSALSGAVYQEENEDNILEDERVYIVNELGQRELVNQDLSGKRSEYRTRKTQLEVITEHISAVFTARGESMVKKPWLPPLNKSMVSPYTSFEGGKCDNGILKQQENPERIHLSVNIGKLDVPEMQEQKDWVYDFTTEGNLLLVASAGYGKTVFLTTVLTSLALSCDVDVLNFYILDFGNNGCMPMRELPHTAEYISFDDEERYWKFKKLMTEEIASRKRRLAQYAAPTLEAYQELSGVSLKKIIVAIDQFDVVKETGIEEEEFFTKLTRDGTGLGIYTIVTTTRMNAIRQATLNNFKNKIACYNFDENETFQAVGRTAIRQADIKGRVLKSGETVYAAQLYTAAPCEDCVEYSKALKVLIQKIRRKYQGKEAPHIPILPQEFYPSMFRKYADDGSSYLAGLDIEEVEGRGFDKTVGLFVIIGTAGTGKTNMLQVIADQAAGKGRTYVFDSKSMELYHYRTVPNVLYVEGRKERNMFMEEISEEVNHRRQILKKKLTENRGINPQKLVEEMPFCTILIENPDEFTEVMEEDMKRAMSLINEGMSLGMLCVVTVHAGRPRGMSELDRMIKQVANGLVLSGQGVMPLFPVASMRELPKFGDGLLFKNGIYQRIRLPKYISPV